MNPEKSIKLKSTSRRRQRKCITESDHGNSKLVELFGGLTMNSEEVRSCKKRIPNSDHEIWFEIFARLPIQSLFACLTVCKAWNVKISSFRKKIRSKFSLCGLLLRSSSLGSVDNNVSVNLGYLNLSSKVITSLQKNDRNTLIIRNSDHVDRRFSDLSFDFGGLYPTTNTDLPFDFNRLFIDHQMPQHSQSSCVFFAVNKGLLLVVHENGDYVVHNPATREFTRLPKPPSLQQHENSSPIPLEKTGFVNKLGGTRDGTCSYQVVRLCRVSRVIEVYRSYSKRKCWRVSKLTLDDEELMQACWCWENYVVVIATKTLFFLTNKDRGVAIRFMVAGRYDDRAYVFGLPPVVQQGFENARLGESRRGLFLSYHNPSGVWVWKHGDDGATLTPDAWVPLLEISRYRRISKPLGRKCLWRALKAGDPVMPMAFHPKAKVVFFRIRSFIFTFDLVKNKLVKVARIDENEYGASTVALPYMPSLGRVDVS